MPKKIPPMAYARFQRFDKVLSLAGMTHEYANPALIGQEEGVFERAMAGKHTRDNVGAPLR